MGFGQPAGPPASSKQVRDLLALLQEAGHLDFRDARGPMGFTQRQAGGRFTRDEADAFIAQLTAAPAGVDGEVESEVTASPRGPVTAADRRRAEHLRSLRQMDPELLAEELQRRGWVVMAP